MHVEPETYGMYIIKNYNASDLEGKKQNAGKESDQPLKTRVIFGRRRKMLLNITTHY
jgi:hypothetical protein